jgi:hypothetical protein
MRRRTLLLTVAAVAVLVVAVLMVAAGSLGRPRQSAGVSVGSSMVKPAGLPAVRDGQSAVAPMPAGLTTPGTRVQRSARLSLQVEKGQLDGRIDNVLRMVSDQGGFVAGVQPAPAAADGGGRTGQITFEVPAAKFEDTLVALRRLGTTTDIQMSGVDVSGQYVDLQARLANARAQRDAYIALLDRAQSVQDILAVQDKLGAVTGQIEEYQGRLDALNQTTTYATITVWIGERAPVSQGFGQALAQVGDNVMAELQFLVVALGTLGPFLLAAGLGVGGWWWLRSRRRQQAAGSGQQVASGP